MQPPALPPIGQAFLDYLQGTFNVLLEGGEINYFAYTSLIDLEERLLVLSKDLLDGGGHEHPIELFWVTDNGFDLASDHALALLSFAEAARQTALLRVFILSRPGQCAEMLFEWTTLLDAQHLKLDDIARVFTREAWRTGSVLVQGRGSVELDVHVNIGALVGSSVPLARSLSCSRNLHVVGVMDNTLAQPYLASDFDAVLYFNFQGSDFSCS